MKLSPPRRKSPFGSKVGVGSRGPSPLPVALHCEDSYSTIAAVIVGKGEVRSKDRLRTLRSFFCVCLESLHFEADLIPHERLRV